MVNASHLKRILQICCIYSVFAVFCPELYADPLCNDWSSADTRRELGWQAVNIIDWKQTRVISKDTKYEELNPLLGKYPSTRAVDNFFLVSTVLHSATSCALEPTNRRYWQYISLLFSSAAVINNRRLGIRINF